MLSFRRSFFTWVSVGVLCLTLGACAGRAPVPPVVEVEPGPVLTSEEVLATLYAREAGMASLKGLFQADVAGSFSPFSLSIQGTLLYQQPGSIRMKAFTRFGGTIFDFLLHGPSYALHLPGRDHPIVGHVPNFGPLGDLIVPVQLSLSAIDVLLGKVGWAPEQFRGVQVVKTAYRYTVSLSPVNTRDDSVLQYVWVDRHSALILAVDYRTSGGQQLATITASDFRSVSPSGQEGAMVLPFVVEVQDHVTSRSITLEFSELVPNVPVSENEFASR